MPPFANSATGATSAAGSMWIGAQIHDFDAMDKALLAQLNNYVELREWTSGAGRETSPSGSVAALKANAAAAATAVQEQAADNLAHAKQCLADGKPGVAKIYFQMAAKHATGEVKQEALAGLQSLSPKSAIADK